MPSQPQLAAMLGEWASSQQAGRVVSPNTVMSDANDECRALVLTTLVSLQGVGYPGASSHESQWGDAPEGFGRESPVAATKEDVQRGIWPEQHQPQAATVEPAGAKAGGGAVEGTDPVTGAQEQEVAEKTEQVSALISRFAHDIC